MENIFLDEKTANDVDTRVAKILRDLGDPEPPLRLEIVRDLLELDKGFYSGSDSGVLQETAHRLKVAGKQVFRRPGLLWDAVKKFDLKALWVPDRKRILLDSELPTAKQRWGEAHEIGHSILPWHEIVMHGDGKQTLSFTCEQQVEAEANYAAGRMLFLQEAFVERLESSPVTFDRVKALSNEFGNTMTSTLWRVVESQDGPAFGLVSRHPRKAAADGQGDVRYFLRSPMFAVQFAQISAAAIFHALGSFCFGSRGPIGQKDVLMKDINGAQHVFFVETFYNSYDALTLGLYRHVRAPAVAISGVIR